MGILIPRHALKNRQQTLKLFSNPVSGIACHWDTKSNYELAHGGYHSIKDIRYSKSMIIGALRFWLDQMYKYRDRLQRVYNPLNPNTKVTIEATKYVQNLESCYVATKLLPDHFLFSHRYVFINRSFKYEPLMIQQRLLKKKYPDLQKIWFEKGTLAPVSSVVVEGVDIQFSIYLNEYPYLERAKIAEVGKTDKGKVFIIKK